MYENGEIFWLRMYAKSQSQSVRVVEGEEGSSRPALHAFDPPGTSLPSPFPLPLFLALLWHNPAAGVVGPFFMPERTHNLHVQQEAWLLQLTITIQVSDFHYFDWHVIDVSISHWQHEAKRKRKEGRQKEEKKAKGHKLQLADESKRDEANGIELWAVQEFENKGGLRQGW